MASISSSPVSAAGWCRQHARDRLEQMTNSPVPVLHIRQRTQTSWIRTPVNPCRSRDLRQRLTSTAVGSLVAWALGPGRAGVPERQAVEVPRRMNKMPLDEILREALMAHPDDVGGNMEKHGTTDADATCPNASWLQLFWDGGSGEGGGVAPSATAYPQPHLGGSLSAVLDWWSSAVWPSVSAGPHPPIIPTSPGRLAAFLGNPASLLVLVTQACEVQQVPW